MSAGPEAELVYLQHLEEARRSVSPCPVIACSCGSVSEVERSRLRPSVGRKGSAFRPPVARASQLDRYCRNAT